MTLTRLVGLVWFGWLYSGCFRKRGERSSNRAGHVEAWSAMSTRSAFLAAGVAIAAAIFLLRPASDLSSTRATHFCYSLPTKASVTVN